jgi:AsmA-like protein
MAIRRKWLRLAIAILASLALAQFAVGMLVRTRRVHAYLIARLERSFGRQVEVSQFDAQVFPSLRLDANGITVGEDPVFGNEYFLRAEKLTAGVRWAGLLGGHFEFGTLVLSRPSLILVHNSQGRWNLEDWLPPAKSGELAARRIYGPPAATGAANRLRKIQFDDGRVNFKTGENKQPFAFIAVTGSVEQVSRGRWQLQLEAQPWRSGVALQSAGTLHVRGDVAGTSARLQPAQFEVHWTEASLADLLRLLRGQDYGVRGTFALDVAGRSGIAPAGDTAVTKREEIPAAAFAGQELPSDWTFTVEARAGSIHRWDLTERADNPRFTMKLAGRGNIAARTLDVTQLALTTPASNLRGTLHVAGAVPVLEVDSAGIQASDVLAWWRAFEPNVDEALVVDQYFTGSASIRGWPPTLEQLAFSSNGGVIKVPGIAEPLWIGAMRGGSDRNKMAMEPVRLQLGGERPAVLAAAMRRRGANSPGTPFHDAGDLTASEDFSAHEGGVVIEAEVEHIAAVLRAAAAIGRPLQHGWDLDGRALGSVRWDWNRPRGQRWSGRVVVSKAHLAVAGLNQQLQVSNAACVWDHGKRGVLLGAVEGFGTSWSGTLRESPVVDADGQAHWNFSLHGGELDATEIDRWVGPRARPGWLRSLLNSLGGTPNDESQPGTGNDPSASVNTSASGLLRQVDALGDLSLDALTIENLKLENLHAAGQLHGLQLEASDITAQWAGGKVRGKLSAKFSPRPVYDITAQLDGASLGKLPSIPNISDRLSGVASGSVHLTTEGVGRADLLQNLAGQGKVSLRSVEFRGWDVGASVADGAAHAGISHWDSGAGAFTLLRRTLQLDAVRLDGGKQLTLMSGTIDFARQAELSIKTADAGPPSRLSSTGNTLKLSGPLDAPTVTVDAGITRDTASASAP